MFLYFVLCLLQLHEALTGCYDDVIDRVTVIDCRYPYEYDGGHIKVSMYSSATHDLGCLNIDIVCFNQSDAGSYNVTIKALLYLKFKISFN